MGLKLDRTFQEGSLALEAGQEVELVSLQFSPAFLLSLEALSIQLPFAFCIF